jgi:serine/threonine-protein kinase
MAAVSLRSELLEELDVDPCEERVGEVICDRWRLVRLLGVGGMAAVYEAVHKVGRRVAIKILHAHLAREAQVRARFEQEAHAVNRLKHPGAVAIDDVDVTAQGEPFLVMELLEGESVAQRVARERASFDETYAWLEQVLDCLAAAHDHAIVHRDIKPDNLFLTTAGRLKVLDFGIARLRATAAVKTRTGTCLGTPAYMPPEQVKGIDVDHRADIFAVGAVAFELVSGRTVHAGETEQQMLVMMLTLPAPRLATVAPWAPPALCQVVDRALAFEPADRYPDARSMLADLRAAREGRLAIAAAAPARTQPDTPAVAPAATLPDAPAPPPARAARGPQRLVAGVAVAGLLAGTAAVVGVARCGIERVEGVEAGLGHDASRPLGRLQPAAPPPEAAPPPAAPPPGAPPPRVIDPARKLLVPPPVVAQPPPPPPPAKNEEKPKKKKKKRERDDD